MRERYWRVECAAVCEREYRSAHWRGFGRSVGEGPEARLTVEKKLEMETWLVMRLVRILKPEREPR